MSAAPCPVQISYLLFFFKKDEYPAHLSREIVKSDSSAVSKCFGGVRGKPGNASANRARAFSPIRFGKRSGSCSEPRDDARRQGPLSSIVRIDIRRISAIKQSDGTVTDSRFCLRRSFLNKFEPKLIP